MLDDFSNLFSFTFISDHARPLDDKYYCAQFRWLDQICPPRIKGEVYVK